jgi:hypothetical protein
VPERRSKERRGEERRSKERRSNERIAIPGIIFLPSTTLIRIILCVLT